ncbi:hypothetical protein SAMN03003324_03900 [Pedobacter antarcticus]|uniref:DUF3846 domain-containing protein n=1 Tax=Pedobacter antarcticus TaxID=34086 RepID=A0A1I2IRE8_9SPHI|nr:hypothetical protein [Pedobacter antarcticus]SFF44218.1 hypothetical protein SAMN03003324_03900 [Pedobacter antarcticus]
MKIRAFKIDSLNREIVELQIDPSLKVFNEVIGCRCVDVIRLDALGTDVIYIDDEGLYQVPEGAFSVRGLYGVFSGNGLVVGTFEGQDVDCTTTLDKLKKLIRFEDPHYRPEPALQFIVL